MAQAGIDILIRAKNEVAKGLDDATKTIRTGVAGMAKDAGGQFAAGVIPSFTSVQGALVGALSDGAIAATKAMVDEITDGLNGGQHTLDEAFRNIGVAGGQAVVDGLKSVPIVGAIGSGLASLVDSVTGGTMAMEEQQATSRKAAEAMQAHAIAIGTADGKLADYISTLTHVKDEEDQYAEMLKRGMDLINERAEIARKAAGEDLAAVRESIKEREREIGVLNEAVEKRRQMDAEAKAAKQEQAELEEWLAEQRKLADQEEQERQRDAERMAREAEQDAAKALADQQRQREEMAQAETRLSGAVESRATRAASFRQDASTRAAAQTTSPAAVTAANSTKQLTYFEQLLKAVGAQTEEFKKFNDKMPEFVTS